MVSLTAAWQQPDDAIVNAQLTDLSHVLLPRYVAGLGLALVCWLYWACARAGAIEFRHLAFVACSIGGMAGALSLRSRNESWAALVFTLGLCAADGLILWAYQDIALLSLGTVTIIVASTLLGTAAAIGAGLGQIALAMALVPGSWPNAGVYATGYALVGGALLVARGPWEDTIEQALEGWQLFRQALQEARSRRGELRRMLQALEEATYRIERMNNELLLARHQAELARANKARFAATVSHELRGPLNLILGFSRLMVLSPERYGVALPAPYREDLDAIHQSSEHIVSLLDDVLDLSQVEVDQMPLIKRRVSVPDIVHGAVEVVRPLASRKGLYVEVESLADDTPVLADPVRLRQVVLNLLTNAVRFTHVGGITVSVSESGGELVVEVADTGRGIPQEELPKLFQEFTQLPSRDKDGESKGSGLGLAISKHLVQLHGGRVWADSSEGVGTRVCFSLPIGERGLPSRRPSRDAQSPPVHEAFDVCLVVHQDPEMVKLIARQLSEYRVVGVSESHDDLDSLIDEYHPRAIIAPPEVAEALHQHVSALGAEVPVVACSMPQMGRQAKIEGALTYLMKPITGEMVQGLVASVAASSARLDVLVVDDDPDAVRLMEILLDSLDQRCHVSHAYDGQQALDLMRQSTPDLVFMDLMMPVLDGEATLAQMRADEQLRHVPVAVISARDMVANTLTFGTQIGVRSQRPVSLAQGVRRLRALLEAITPSYLPEQDSGQPPLATRVSQSA